MAKGRPRDSTSCATARPAKNRRTSEVQEQAHDGTLWAGPIPGKPALVTGKEQPKLDGQEVNVKQRLPGDIWLCETLEGLTANIAAKNLKPPSTGTNLLEKAATALRPTVSGGRLPCRRAEQEQIRTHISSSVKQGGSRQVLYVSGMPGTGKTASVLEIVRQESRKTSKFKFVHMNAMSLANPNTFFAEVLKCLRSGKFAMTSAHQELSSFFAERKESDPVIVLLIDELDYLVTRNQAVLYRVFDWLGYPQARLVLVTISNTMDVPERLLPRITSRFEITRVDFEPYSRDQICTILKDRLQAHGAGTAFTTDALKLCAGRVAAGSGDVRKALQLCRHAVQMRLATGGGVVEFSHMDSTARDLLHANPTAQAVRGQSVMARRFLASLLLELRRKGVCAAPLPKVVARFKKVIHSMPDLCEVPESEAQHADDAACEALRGKSLISRQADSCRSHPCTLLALGGGLDAEDLATALLAVEDDESIRELLRCEVQM
eukprot:CAMPEP_0170646076 /NCGR_PEP_ID=MMETSP0224-20130122/43433_1 /TAXON_ID=285029 /ORGANISM="Togula jolla, Strain CCCM 725" /LENGTH=490 /DNA_ID=CAMNT_0010977361 /DNA_START=30 /DNA_END=1503 /DNA_ORIENTATION=-